MNILSSPTQRLVLLAFLSTTLAGRGLALPTGSTNAPATAPVSEAAAATSSASSFPASVAEIVKMHQAGVSPDVIQAFVERSAQTYPLGADDLIQLSSLGLPAPVLSAMLQRPGSASAPPTPQTPPASAPIQVTPTYVSPPATVPYYNTTPATSVIYYDTYPVRTYVPYWPPSLVYYWGGGYRSHAYSYWHGGGYAAVHGAPCITPRPASFAAAHYTTTPRVISTQPALARTPVVAHGSRAHGRR
ncbi:MAG TPA: hypothetical protein DCM86_13455 [Verrucomicrobiales bacterium]|nr:hypothetical protein [Verrucomicrobiales bacterium]